MGRYIDADKIQQAIKDYGNSAISDDEKNA